MILRILSVVGFWSAAGAQTSGFVPPKYGVRRLGPARIVADTPGGGGWGDPFTRLPELVLRDVRDGVVSPTAAERDYGVVLRYGGTAVDVERTEILRGIGRR